MASGRAVTGGAAPDAELAAGGVADAVELAGGGEEHAEVLAAGGAGDGVALERADGDGEVHAGADAAVGLAVAQLPAARRAEGEDLDLEQGGAR